MWVIMSQSEISKGNVLGYYREFSSLRYGNEYSIPGRELYASVASFGEIWDATSKRPLIYSDAPAHFGGLWQTA